MTLRRVRRSRVVGAALVLGIAVSVVIAGLRRGQRVQIGVCSAIGAGAVLTQRHGDAVAPIITWSVAFLGASGALALGGKLVKWMAYR